MSPGDVRTASLTVSGTVVNGTMGATTDNDYFVVQLAGGKTLTSTLTMGASSADYDLIVYNSVGTEIERFCCSRSIGRTSGSGTTIQPTRQPVMQKYFENELITSASGDSSAAVTAGNA